MPGSATVLGPGFWLPMLVAFLGSTWWQVVHTCPGAGSLGRGLGSVLLGPHHEARVPCMLQKSHALVGLGPGSLAGPTEGAVPSPSTQDENRVGLSPLGKSGSQEEEWMLGSPKPTDSLKVALWTKERALSKISVAQRTGGWSSGVCPCLRLAMNEALGFTHVWFPGEKLCLARPKSQLSPGPSQRGEGLREQRHPAGSC